MRLWTIQPEEVVELIENTGVFRCDLTKSIFCNDFQSQYAWMASEMDKRGILHPEGVEYPVWAWHTRNWHRKKPDFRFKGLGERGERLACIEFEIPEEHVLLSDFDNWHFVLNDMWLDDSKCEVEWTKCQLWFDSLPETEQKKLKEESWQKIFDIEPIHSDWSSKGCYIQATTWELRKEMIQEIRYFIAK